MKNTAISIVKKLIESGYEAFFAGGCVRDMLMHIEPHDYDIATNATPETVESLFDNTVPVGKAFGVVIVDGIEVATFRSDGTYSDGRRPDSVKFGTMQEDALRRDLTINGLFMNPLSGHVHDFVGGVLDIHNKLIKFIGDPQERIIEDRLRMLRAIRFAVKFDFEIDPPSKLAIWKNSASVLDVSWERIRDEFTKMLRLHKPLSSISLLNSLGLLKYILPEVAAMNGVLQPPEYHKYDVLRHTAEVLNGLPKDASDELLYGALLHDVGKPPTYTVSDRIRFSGHDEVGAKMSAIILERLKFSNDFIERVVMLVANHMRWMVVKDMRIGKLKRFMRMDYFDEHKALHKADCQASHGGLENLEFVNGLDFPPEKIRPTPLVAGQDLIDMGHKPGPIFKTILTAVEDAQLDGSINTKEEALAFVKAMGFVV